MSSPPKTMRAFGFKSFTRDVKKLEVLEVPVPVITGPNDIIVEIKASSLNPGEVLRPTGISRFFESVKLPVIIGMDFSGIIRTVGSSVTNFTPGDRVYGMNVPGSCLATYLLLTPSHHHSISKIPASLSFEEAASLPIVAHTAICALQKAEREIDGGLRGKTVLVPAGLGGVGSIAVMLLKPVFGAGTVITTVSTAKLGLVTEMLGEGLVDQIVDYTKEDVVRVIGQRKVDFLFLTVMGPGMDYLPLVKEGGLMLSIMGKSGETLKRDFPGAPWVLVKVVDLWDWVLRWRAGRWGVRYEDVWSESNDENAELIEKWVGEGKLKAVIGREVGWGEVEEVKAMYELVASWKGSVGKNVVRID